MKIRFSSDELFRSASAVSRRFPVPLFYALAFSVIAIDYSRNEILLLRDLSLATSLAVPLGIALTFLKERYVGHRYVPRFFPHLTHLFAILLYFSFRERSDGRVVFQYLQAFLATHLLVSFSAFLRKNEDENLLWGFNQSLFFRWITAAIFSGTLYAGVIAALLGIKTLFHLEPWGSKFYFDFFIVCGTAFHAVVFLSGAPDPNEARSPEYPKILRIFCQYLLIPLLCAYLFILYAYLGKIIVEGVLPEGQVSYLVSGAGVFGIFAFLLVYPIRNLAESRWIRIFANSFAYALFPLVILMCVSIHARTSAYGFTETRYFMTVLSFWLAAMAVVLLRYRDHAVRLIPMTLFLLTLATTVGPWSAWNVSLRSQTSRLLAILDRDHLRKEGMLTPSTAAIAAADQKDLSSIFDYLIDRHGLRSIDFLIPSELNAELRKERGQSTNRASIITPKLMAFMGQTYANAYPAESGTRFSYSVDTRNANLESIEIGGFTGLVPHFYANASHENDGRPETGARIFILNEKQSAIEIYAPAVSGKPRELLESAPLLPFVNALHDRLKTGSMNSLTREQMTYEPPLHSTSLRILFSSLSGKWSEKPNERAITYLDAVLLYRAL